MHIKTCNYSILCNEIKNLLLLIIKIKNIHEFNVLNLNLWILFTQKKRHPSLIYFTMFSPFDEQSCGLFHLFKQMKYNKIIHFTSHQNSTMAQLPKRGTILLMKHFVRPNEVTSK